MTRILVAKNTAIFSGRMGALGAGGWFGISFPRGVNRVIISTNSTLPMTYTTLASATGTPLVAPGVETAMVATTTTAATAAKGSRIIPANSSIYLEFESPIFAIAIQNNAGGAVDIQVEGHIVGSLE